GQPPAPGYSATQQYEHTQGQQAPACHARHDEHLQRQEQAGKIHVDEKISEKSLQASSLQSRPASGLFAMNKKAPAARPELQRHVTKARCTQLRFATNGETCARTGDHTRRTSMLPTPSMAPCMTS